MAKKKRARPDPVPRIELATVENKLLRCSFKHLDMTNPKFDPSKCSAEYFCRLLAVVQRFSTWTVAQFIDQSNKEHRHIIDFARTSEPDGFQNIPGLDPDQIGYADGWQFSVYPEVPWSDLRAHGILIDDTFYIVWLDPEHKLFPKNLALGA
jgi:hypothetical protein